MKYWTKEKIKSAKYDEVIKELKSILKDFHYDSDTENMSKDVVIALENLIGDLKWNIAKDQSVILIELKIE